MYNLFEVADYIYNRYLSDFKEKIDEMKLHKLLYFAQRESIIVKNELLFDATFYGWKYGPVLKEIREYYKNNNFCKKNKQDFDENFNYIMNRVFDRYAEKSSWSLSRLSHGEISWQKSREGIPDDSNGDNPINNADIFEDAKRIRERINRFSVNGGY